MPYSLADFNGTFWTIQDGKYYVSTIGNDVTGNGSPQNPFLTIHRVFEDENLTTGDKIVIGPNEFVLYDAIGMGGGAIFSCRVATTTSLLSLSGTMTIDGVLLDVGDRVLVCNQIGAALNGIYIVATGAWTRDENFNSAENMVQGALVGVSVGTINGKSIFQFTTASEITVGSTSLTFEKRNSSEWGLIGGSIGAQTDLMNALAEKATPKGLLDCSAEPNYPAGVLGDYYYVSVAGKIGGASGLDVIIGSRIECLATSSAGGDQASVGSEWVVIGNSSSAGGMANIVEDTTPQLGANLDANNFNILFDDLSGIRDQNGNEQFVFRTTASAINHFEVKNSAASGNVELAAAGDDTNIGIYIHGKGNGNVLINSVHINTVGFLDGVTRIFNDTTDLSLEATGNIIIESPLQFDTASRTIAGIQNQNLVDKSSAETIAAEWRFDEGARIDARVQTTTGGSTTIISNSKDFLSGRGLTSNLTFPNPSGTPTQGQPMLICLEDNGTPRTITWSGSQWRAIGVTLPTTTIANKIMYLACVWDSVDSKWDVLGVKQEI